MREVLGLSEAQQKHLIDKAIAQKWGRRKMAEEAKKLRGKTGDGRGRPALPMFVKSIHALEKYIDKDADPFADLSMDKLKQLDGQEATKLYKTVAALKLKCEELQSRLLDAVPGFGGAIDAEGVVERQEPPRKKGEDRKPTKNVKAEVS